MSKWSATPPTEAGWYWWRRENNHPDYPIRGITEIRIFEQVDSPPVPFIWSPESKEKWVPMDRALVDLWGDRIQEPES